MENMIKDFLRDSIKGNLELYDFEEFFNDFRNTLGYKLSEHGILGFDNFEERQEELYDFSGLDQYEIITDYVYFSNEDVKNAILQAQYEVLKDTFEDDSTFQDLKVLYEKLEFTSNLSLEEKTLLFDSCIHAEHITGMILDDINMEDLKEEIEKEFKGINQFLTV